jgi:hypothetical protein
MRPVRAIDAGRWPRLSVVSTICGATLRGVEAVASASGRWSRRGAAAALPSWNARRPRARSRNGIDGALGEYRQLAMMYHRVTPPRR